MSGGSDLDEELLVPLTRYEIWLCEQSVDAEISRETMGYPQRPLIHSLRALLARLRYCAAHAEPSGRRHHQHDELDDSPF